jgi:hypothetical protein
VRERDRELRGRLDPTYAGNINRVECNFWATQEFVVRNADYVRCDQRARHGAPPQLPQQPQRNGRLAELERPRRVA